MKRLLPLLSLLAPGLALSQDTFTVITEAITDTAAVMDAPAEPDSIEKVNICKSSVYVLASNNLSFSMAKYFAESVSERLKENVKNIKLVDTYYDTKCQSLDCAWDDVKNTDASHVFFLSAEIDRLTTESVITFRNISYARDSDEILPDSEKDLNLLLDLLKEYPRMTIELNSHTDKEGDADYNKDLSQRRAAKVWVWLVGRGVIPDRISAIGWGEIFPAIVSKREAKQYPYLVEGFPLTENFIASLSTEEQRDVADSLNRRTEVRIIEFQEENQLKGILDIGLFSIDHDPAASDSVLSLQYIIGSYSHFFGVEKNLFPKAQEMVAEIFDIVNIETCEEPNNPPVAVDQLVPVGADSVLFITLSASDPDKDTLTFSISMLPSHGTLYQIKDDNTTGDEITTTPIDVLNLEHKIMYLLGTDFTVTDTLSFLVSDGEDTSEPANIIIGEFTFFEILLNRSPFLDFVASTPPIWITAGGTAIYWVVKGLIPEPPPKKPIPPVFPDPG